MGFNKRYINEETIRRILKEEGLFYLIEHVNNVDSLIIEDEFSMKVCDIIKTTKKHSVLEKLLELKIF